MILKYGEVSAPGVADLRAINIQIVIETMKSDRITQK